MGLLIVLLVFVGAVAAVALVTKRDRRRRQLERDNAKMREALNEIENIARNNYELSPQMGQIVLDVINSYHQKNRELL